MKAVVHDRYGSPGVLRIEDVPKPVPGDGEVLVKVHAVSINAWDWDMLTGRPLEYRVFSGLLRPRSRKIHGCDIAGTVEAAGRKVRHFTVGDEVFGDLAERGWGAFAEVVCAPQGMVLPKPAGMGFDEAACLAHGGNLAVQGLIDFGRIAPGQRVLINGGGGSTGTLAIQIAKTFDVHVTAVDRGEKQDLMRSLGADRTVNFTKDDVTEKKRKYDLIFDVKTTRSVFDYLRVLAPSGVYVSIGGQTSRLLQLLLLGRITRRHRLHLVGYRANKDSRYLVELFQAGKLRPAIDTCYPLEKAADAFRHYGDGRFKGKVVIRMDSD
jgi:NADPH:quinone reductase-like Zn-dependent oxidoreductase